MKRHSSNSKAVLAFVKAVAGIPEVLLVLSDQGDQGPTVTTILDADVPDDTPRDRVYHAEMNVLQQFPTALIDFKLFNARELTASLDSVIGTDISPVYARHPMSRAS